jgi:hypothetical protein
MQQVFLRKKKAVLKKTAFFWESGNFLFMTCATLFGIDFWRFFRMATLAVVVGGILEGGEFFVCHSGRFIMAGFAFLNLLTIDIRNFFAGSIFGMMALTTGNFLLMLGVIEGGWFCLGGGINGSLQGEFGRAFVGGNTIGGQAQTQCQSKDSSIDYGFIHRFPPFD